MTLDGDNGADDRSRDTTATPGRLKEIYERIQAYLAFRPGPLQGSDPLFATTACYGPGGDIVTEAGKPLSPRAIHRIITEGLLLAGVRNRASWCLV